MQPDTVAVGDMVAGICNGTGRSGVVVVILGSPDHAFLQANDGTLFMCRGVRRIVVGAAKSLQVRFSRAVHRLTARPVTITVCVEGIDFSFEIKPAEKPKSVGWTGTGHGYLPVAGVQTLVTVKTTISIDGAALWREAPIEYHRSGP